MVINMKISELAEKCGWKALNFAEDREVEGCYIGDLLSWVMGRAQENNVWLTVMGNVNAIAVAVLADTSAIVLTENSALDAEALARAQQRGVNIYSTEDNTYETAKKVIAAIE